MNEKERVAELLGVKPKFMKPFEVDDPYNENNDIEGFICFYSDNRYGSLVITHVNDIETEPQVIYCMPKIKYPFGITDGGDRIYNWPENWKSYRAYSKWDGTNICSYSYADEQGLRYITHKTRLTPILRTNTAYGDFKGLWDICLERNPALIDPEEVGKGWMSYCYELYGYQNPHLVKYDVDIACVPLLKVNQQSGEIGVPDTFKVGWSAGYAVQGFEEITAGYERLREVAQKRNEGLEEGEFVTEGYVVFVTCDGFAWTPVKCKPEIIEQIHWSRGVIPYNSVYTTVVNALENMEYTEINRDSVRILLEEEYSDEQIESSTARIDRAIVAVVEHAERVVKVKKLLEDYLMYCGRRCGKIIRNPFVKSTVMRYLSDFFPKSDMRKVYNAVRELGFLPSKDLTISDSCI